jgi:hypothetical protein
MPKNQFRETTTCIASRTDKRTDLTCLITPVKQLIKSSALDAALRLKRFFKYLLLSGLGEALTPNIPILPARDDK